MEKQRLSKVLAAAGIASRRACEELIFNGVVKVNGVITKKQILVNPNVDEITVRDQPIKAKESKVYYLLNKPPGFICTNKRSGAQSKLVLDLFKEEGHRLFTVGRLDKDTQGLLIVTNDGHFANQVIHPSSDIQKDT